MNKQDVLEEIKGFLDGHNKDIKYLVNVETDPSNNYAECIIHPPNEEYRIDRIQYEPFMYMKDLSKVGLVLYPGKDEKHIEAFQKKHGISIVKLETGNQERLLNGFCYKVTSSKSFNNIINYFKEGGIDPYEKARDFNGRPIRDDNDRYVYLYRDNFYSVRTNEQFFISTGVRLFKGYNEYKEVNRLTFDIETTGLRYEIHRVFEIGVRNNRGFETILEVSEKDNDEAEIKLIKDFFYLIDYLKPAVISGYNSEDFDFTFILGRAELLGIDLNTIPTSLKKEKKLKRIPNSSVKYGNTADRYTATYMWGYSNIDILHAAKRTAAINTDIKNTKLKYIAKFEDVAKPDRVYIDGEDNGIGKMHNENKVFLINKTNEYIEIPNQYQKVGKQLFILQEKRKDLEQDKYNEKRLEYFNKNPEFIDWFKINAKPNGMTKFISGKKIVRRYLLDDLWETEQVDERYNQSSFMMAKIVPTTYARICTMGTASVWNLLLVTWSYENDIAIPIPDKMELFSGGLARCYKIGYTERIIKIDFASLYPMIQLSENVFPIFDITGVIKKMLLYLTTTRNIYKKLANGDELNEEEILLLNKIDYDSYEKHVNNKITDKDEVAFKVKQLPVKILNNSLFGALGANIAFNWSDNVSAARITCTGRIHLRHAIKWFEGYGLQPLLTVTDGINFQYPENTKYKISGDKIIEMDIEAPIDEMWKYNNITGVNALIAYFNDNEMVSDFMSVDNDGVSLSCLNLARINYAMLTEYKDKKTGEVKEKIKLTGNTIKSKTMPEYIEDFLDNGLKLILQGKGKEFVEYYYDYVDDIRYMQIPLKKIASKSKVKVTLNKYKNRGTDKNGRIKAKQAHMELLTMEREEIAWDIFNKRFRSDSDKEYNIEEVLKLVSNYLPPEPELDSYVYYINDGYKKSHGDSAMVRDKITKEFRFCSRLINNRDLLENPNMTGKYNYAKYLDAFNNRVSSILVGFKPEVRDRLLVKLNKNDELVKELFTNKELELTNFDSDLLDESMYLEDPEIKFWNKTGFDPRLIWDGFKVYDDNKIHFEIYEHAIDYVNKKMNESGKKQIIKSVNDKYENGDLVLIKNGSKYNLGLFNGVYLHIVKTNVKIPKSDYELQLIKIKEENEIKLNNLKIELAEKSEKEKFLEAESKLRDMLFVEFKDKFNIPKEMSMDDLFAAVKNTREAFEDYYVNAKNELENQEIEYLGVDGE